MSTARENILARLRAAETQAPTFDAEPQPPPEWGMREKRLRFIERMEAVRAEVIETSADDLATVLASWLASREVRSLLHDPGSRWAEMLHQAIADGAELPELIAFNREIELWKRSLFDNVDAALTTTLGGIAETGSLMLWPSADEPRSMSLVPPIHIAVLEEKQLYATFAEALEQQQWAEAMPSNALLISGPSKSADIERTLAYGVHGPKELLVLLLRDEDEEAS